MGKNREMTEYVRSVSQTPFEIGVFDCLIFTNNCFRIIYGKGWCDDWLGRYCSLNTRGQLKREFGFDDVFSALDSKLVRGPVIPKRWSLCISDKASSWIMGTAFGFSIGNGCLFLDKVGTRVLPISEVSASWHP